MRSIELDENIHREGLTDYETTKARLAEITQVEARLRTEAKQKEEKEAENTGGHVSQKSKKRGQPKKPDSTRKAAKETGVDRKTRRKMEAQVEVAEKFPFMQNSAWGRVAAVVSGQMNSASEIVKKQNPPKEKAHDEAFQVGSRLAFSIGVLI